LTFHARGGLKKIRQSWRVQPGISALADRTGSENTRRINQNETKTLTSSKTSYETCEKNDGFSIRIL
jgi:hypothetical protein